MPFQLTSPAFADGTTIPKAHTCEGPDVSPKLHWTDPPTGTRCFALIVDDPDAPGGTWVHWVLYNLPGDRRELQEGLPREDRLPDGTSQGMNDFRKVGYGGPCPPPGKPHRYVFTLYALETPVALKPRATKAHLLEACKGHILGEAKLTGRFGR